MGNSVKNISFSFFRKLVHNFPNLTKVVPQYLNAHVLFLLISSEIFQLTHRYWYQFVGGSYDGYVKHKRNNPMCDPWDSQGNEKMQFLFLLLLALTFLSEMRTSFQGMPNKNRLK